MSRDDSGSFLPQYQEQEIVKRNPFQTIDQNGVGKLMQMGVERAEDAARHQARDLRRARRRPERDEVLPSESG